MTAFAAELRRGLPNVLVSPSFLALLALFSVWEVASRLWEVAFFPPLSAVFVRVGEMLTDGSMVASLTTSLTNLAIGFVIAVVMGLGIGALMGISRRANLALEMYVYALLTVPSLVFAPVFFAIWGLGREPIIGVIVMYSTFIVMISTVDAVRGVPATLIEMSTSFNASRAQTLRSIVLPSATPMLMAGLRVGATRAVRGMVAGEMFIALVGLGKILMSAGRNLDATTVFAVLVVLIIIASVLAGVIQIVDSRLTRWLPSTYQMRE